MLMEVKNDWSCKKSNQASDPELKTGNLRKSELNEDIKAIPIMSDTFEANPLALGVTFSDIDSRPPPPKDPRAPRVSLTIWMALN